MIGVGVHADVHDLAVLATTAPACGPPATAASSAPTGRRSTPASARATTGCRSIESNYVAIAPDVRGLRRRRPAGQRHHRARLDRRLAAHRRRRRRRRGLRPARGRTATSASTTAACWTASDGSADESPLRRGGARRRGGRRRARASAAPSTPRRPRSRHAARRPAGTDGRPAAGRHDRAWYTEDWARRWVTLPTRHGSAHRRRTTPHQDAFGEKITVCRWQSPDVAWVLGEGRARALRRAYPAPTPPAAPARGRPRAADPPARASRTRRTRRPPRAGARRRGVDRHRRQPRPDADADAGQQRGTKGALYLGTTGHPTNDDVDTLWWFDGDETWHPTGLRNAPTACRRR